MAVDDLTLRNLVYAKRLFMHGVEHSVDETEIDRTVAILHLDNAIERLLYCILTVKGLPISQKSKFHDLWAQAQKAPGSQIMAQFNQGASELHHLRNSVQHEGVIPSPEDLSKYEGFTKELMTKIIKAVFNLDFERVSLSLFIRNKEVRGLYTQAEKAFETDDYENCLLNCLKAFDSAKTDEQSSIYGSGLSWPILSLRSLAEKNKGKANTGGRIRNPCMEAISEVCSQISDAVGVISKELEVLKLRMDYKRYRQFADIFPSYNSTESEVKDIKPEYRTKEKAVFALHFVLDCVLKWESLKRPRWFDSAHESVQSIAQGAKAVVKELKKYPKDGSTSIETF